MAGYKSRGDHIYDGLHFAAEDLTNGLFVTINANNKVAKLAAKDANIELCVIGKYVQWGGMYFLECDVMKNASSNVYFTEGEWTLDDDFMYDETAWVIKANKLVKMSMPVIHDTLFFSVEKTLYDALNVGDTVNPTTGGTVVKKSA